MRMMIVPPPHRPASLSKLAKRAPEPDVSPNYSTTARCGRKRGFRGDRAQPCSCRCSWGARGICTCFSVGAFAFLCRFGSCGNFFFFCGGGERRRSDALNAFAGDTALPGGKIDAQDVTVEDAAVSRSRSGDFVLVCWRHV